MSDNNAGSQPNPVEQIVAAAWAELLEVDELDVNEDLFEVGAHSLMAMRVMLRLRRELGVELPVEMAFDHATVAELSQAVLEELARQAGGGDLERLLDEVEGADDGEPSAR